MRAAQMNIRMDADLKQAGNAIIAELGHTPSQVVRAVWTYLVVQHQLPSSIAKLVEPANTQTASSKSEVEPLPEGSALVSSFYQRIGVDEPTNFSPTYDELRTLAADERLKAWSLL